MFTIAVPYNKIPGFHKAQLTNYYGLLEAKLMRGNEILEISIKMLQGFLKHLVFINPKLFYSELEIEEKELSEDELRGISQKLTMSQFYRLTERT